MRVIVHEVLDHYSYTNLIKDFNNKKGPLKCVYQ